MSHGSNSELEFELNLAPIIDCLTVLVAFMLISASFLSVAVIDAGVAPSDGTASSETANPNVRLSVFLTEAGNFDLEVDGRAAGKGTERRRIPALADGSWDFQGLRDELSALRNRYPKVEGLSLAAEDQLDYRSVVKTMEVSRDIYPAVMLGGF
jgi:biopolymer transport protein ExbD